MEKTLAGKIRQTLIQYAKTQFLVVIVVTVVSWIVLSLLNIKYALLLAFITGSLSTIPFIGMTTAALLSGMVAVFDGIRFPSDIHPIFEGVTILIIYLIMNQLIDLFLAPYVMGKMTDIRPVFIILSVIIGTWMFGIAGTLLAAPVLLVARTILKYYTK